jgi:aspartate oxidase
MLRELEAKIFEQNDVNRRLGLFENREQLEELRSDLNTRAKAAEKIAEAIRDHTQKQAAAAADAERAAALAKEANERAESAWLKWQADHPATLAAAKRSFATLIRSVLSDFQIGLPRTRIRA